MADVRNVCCGSFDMSSVNQSSTDRGHSGEYDGAAEEEELKQSWILRPGRGCDVNKKRKRKASSVVARSIFLASVVLAASIFLLPLVALALRGRHHHSSPVAPDNYTIALHQALLFFDAQRSGRLPKPNNITWRDDSCLKDEIVGGYYDAGNAVKFSFPTSFAMTMLSWSVIEYRPRYQAAGELEHIKDIIKWGADYLLNTFNSSANSNWVSINSIAAQVGGMHDQECWMRPEDIDSDYEEYPHVATWWSNCPALAAEMSAALAAASIVFRDSLQGYSRKLVRNAEKLFKFASRDQGVNYTGGPDPPSAFYNSSGFWDDFLWAGAWLYCATGKPSYLQLVTSPILPTKDHAFWGGPSWGVLSWDNKHAGAQLLLSRMRIFLGYGYPYEEMLRVFHKHVEDIMCAYLPSFPNFKRTKGGLIQLNHGRPRPLQYVVNAAFLATLYSDYLEAKLIPGWQCGPQIFLNEALREFAKSQIDYILGNNPQSMSYIVGFGDHFPQQVHHRGASIPNDKTKYGCKGGWKWRDRQNPNPNTIVGAMVAGPDKQDGFLDIRSNYSYTEPTMAGNAGLVAVLVALSGGGTSRIDTNTMFYAIPPLYANGPPPPAPWKQ